MPPIRPKIEKKNRKIAKPMLDGNADQKSPYVQLVIEDTTSTISIVLIQYIYAILKTLSQYDSAKMYHISEDSSVDLPCIAAADGFTFICTLDVI